MLSAATATLMLAVPGFPESSLMVPAGLIALVLTVAGAGLSFWCFSRNGTDGTHDRRQPAAQPVPSEETDRQAVLREDTAPEEDDVARRRRQRLAEATRDP